MTTFRLQEKLVTGAVGKTDYLILDGGTVARSNSLDASLEHGRLFKTFFQNTMHLFVGIGNPTAELMM